MMAFTTVQQYLEAVLGLDPESIGKKKLSHIISSCMKHAGIHDGADYLGLILHDAEARGRLIEETVVPETWFFRDAGPFEFLADSFARGDLAASPGSPLRILSVPCSSGEEPYSIAMALLDAAIKPKALHIDAVDISARALAAAQHGAFSRSSFRGSPGPWRQRHFIEKSRTWHLHPDVVRLVRFHQGNILEPENKAGWSAQTYHIIFCRNLFIYLTQEARRIAFERLDRLLEPGGLLFSGHTEVLLFQQFGYSIIADKGCFACRKPGPQEALAAAGQRRSGSRAAVPPARPGSAAKPGPRIKASIFAAGYAQKPDSKEPALATVRALADRGELAPARRLCAQYLGGSGSLNAQAHCLMGEISQAGNMTDQAEKSFLRAVYLDPACYDALVHLSLLYEHKGSRDKALIYRQRASRLRGETA